MAPTAPTHISSHAPPFVWQQYGSLAQTALAHGLHPGVSGTPCEQTGCAQFESPQSP